LSRHVWLRGACGQVDKSAIAAAKEFVARIEASEKELAKHLQVQQHAKPYKP
jgi:hypothetical protein